MHAASCRILQAGRLRFPVAPSVALLSRRNSPAEVENGHAYGETICDLIQNHALQAVGDFAVDLDAPIDWARMHDEAIGLQQSRAFFG
jgi:hypothetical protein